MFHSTHSRATTVQIAEMTRPARFVVFADLAPTPTPTPVPVPQPQPATPSAAAWQHVRDLAAANDAAGAAADVAEESWYSTMLRKLAVWHQRVRGQVVLHEKWQAHWEAVNSRVNQAAVAALGSNLLRAAYADGGTAVTLGMVEKVKQMILANALAGSGVAA